MNLHRVGEKPQWESDDPNHKRNIFQKIAAATQGVVTPGNVISVAGAVFVAAGLVDIAKGKTKSGVIKIGIGRLADLADGYVADKTGTKSPLGEATDVIIDKSELAVALPLLTVMGMVPKPFALAAGTQTVANAYYTKVAKDAGNEIHTGAEGKLSTLFQWAALGMYGVSAVMRESDEASKLAGIIELGADATAFTSVGLGALSVAGYRRDAVAVTPE